MTTITYGQTEGHLRRPAHHFVHSQATQFQFVLRVAIVILRGQIGSGLVCAILFLRHQLVELVVELLKIGVLQNSCCSFTFLKELRRTKRTVRILRKGHLAVNVAQIGRPHRSTSTTSLVVVVIPIKGLCCL